MEKTTYRTALPLKYRYLPFFEVPVRSFMSMSPFQTNSYLNPINSCVGATGEQTRKTS